MGATGSIGLDLLVDTLAFGALYFIAKSAGARELTAAAFGAGGFVLAQYVSMKRETFV